ncbi:MAG: 2-aminoethylphosphonate aminotransferase [Gammaproteobacteria bacterium]|nr:MAG: 2-aminoethylphosphonate aminotransferase [Gammaproteobacteria bacterium]
MNDKCILLNPGPVVLSERVRRALFKPDLCHREPEFAELQGRIRDNLLRVYGLEADEWAAVLLTGSGTSAMEAMVTSLTPDNGRLLVIENGVYGERLARIAAVHGIHHESLHHEWGAPIDLGRLEALLAADRFDRVAVVHHETTTGRLNDLAPVARLCREHGARLLVDGVSSFGAEAIDFEGWGLSGLAATANKCLHGVPGVSFVLARRQELESPPAPRTLYLDLSAYYRQQESGGTPFTQSVQCFYALDEALAELFDEGGRPARQRRYLELAGRVREGLEALGIEPLLPAGDSSCVLTAYRLPEGIGYPALHDHLKAHGFVIYAGQGGLEKTLFRISTMGAIDKADIERLLQAFSALSSPGAP